MGEAKHTPRRCAKHVPECVTDGLRVSVRCANCGMTGSYSNGQRKFGRPRRIIWHRRAFDAAIAKAEGRSHA
jgi:hypothetical protein